MKKIILFILTVLTSLSASFKDTEISMGPNDIAQDEPLQITLIEIPEVTEVPEVVEAPIIIETPEQVYKNSAPTIPIDGTDVSLRGLYG